MSEADERFAERLADDLRRRLGPQVAVLGVELDTSGTSAAMRATWAAGGQRFVSHGSGATALDAYEALATAIAERWLRESFTRVVER